MKIIRILFINILVSFLILCIFLVALEVILRIVKPYRNLTPGTYISDPQRRYKLRPNFSGETFGLPYKINSFGFRDYEYNLLKKDKGTFRILCVGDSFTFGIGLTLEDTYPKQLEQSLQAIYPDKKIEVINCGVPSYNTLYEYLFLKEVDLKYKQDLVIIEYVFNDSVYNRPLTPSNNKLFNALKDLLRKTQSYEWLIDKIYRVDYAFRGYASYDPKFRLERLKYAFSDDYIGWRKNKEAFNLLSELSHKNGIPVIYIIFPKLESFEKDYPYLFFHEKVKEVLKNEPYVLDLLPYFQGKKTDSLWINSYDGHPNKEANSIAVKVITDYLISRKLIHKM